MLFNISDTIITDSFSSDSRLQRAIVNILRSVWESKHLVFIEYDTILFLKNHIEDMDCLSVLTFLQNNYAFLCYDSINFYVNLVTAENEITTRNIEEKTVLDLSIDFFQSTDLLQEARIIGEDMTDVAFFANICNYYIQENDIGNVSLKYEEEHGGGAESYRIFKKHLNNKNKLCLAYCDNDVKYPSCDFGETLKRFGQLDLTSNPLCRLIALEAHEIESILPFNYLSELSTTSHLDAAGINFINTIRASEDSDYLKYYDIKKGINKSKIESNSSYYSFVEKLVPYTNTPQILDTFESLDRSNLIIPRTGKIISKVMETPELFCIIQPELLAYQRHEWDKIGEAFLCWACARNTETLNT